MADILARQRAIVGSTADWAAHNLTLGDGELALERRSDGTVRAKVGDGVANFSTAPYLATSQAVLRFKGTTDPALPPPTMAQSGDAWAAVPGGVIDGSWGPSVAGQTIAEGDLLVMTDSGEWVIVPGAPELAGFVTINDLAAPSGSNTVGFLQAGLGADPRTMQDKGRESVSAQDFGAVGDGTLHTVQEWIIPGVLGRFANFAALQAEYPHVTETTDAIDWAAIQAAINTGFVVYCRAGEYIINKALLLTLAFGGVIGDGYGTYIETNSLMADIFTLGDGSNQIPGLLFKDFRVWSSVVKLGGAVFNGHYVSYFKAENIAAGGVVDYTGEHRLWNGYSFDGFAQCVIDGGEIIVGNDALKCNGKTGQTWGYELTIDGGLRIYQAGGKAVYLGGSAGGVNLIRLDMSLCQYGIWCDDAVTGEYNRELFLGGFCSVDTCDRMGLNVESNGLALLEADASWIAGCGQLANDPGVRFAPGANTNARWIGARIYGNYGNAVEISDGFHNFSGGSIKLNGRGSAGGHGILIGASDDLTINDVVFESNGNATTGKAITLPPGLDNYSIQACTFIDSKQGQPIEVGGGFVPSPTRMIRNNRGFVTERRGTAAIGAGATSVTVTHGMAVTPNWPLVSNIGHSTVPKVQNLNATTFDIAVDTAPGGTINFAWAMDAN